MTDPTILWQEGDQPEPLSDLPLQGLEIRVLANWMENSRNVRLAHQKTPELVESAARMAVWQALTQELQLRSQGMAPQEAEEFTRPAMWTPPTFPTT